MNEKTVAERLIAVAFHVVKHDLLALSDVDVTFDTTKVTLWTRDDSDLLVPFLQWVDSLGDAAEILGSVHKSSYHLRVFGVLVTGERVEVMTILNDHESAVMVEELGDRAGRRAISRTQLAKIADPELLNDQEPVAP